MNLVWWGRRYNKSLNRSGISGPFIREARMLDSLLSARLIPPLSRLAVLRSPSRRLSTDGFVAIDRASVVSQASILLLECSLLFKEVSSNDD